MAKKKTTAKSRKPKTTSVDLGYLLETMSRIADLMAQDVKLFQAVLKQVREQVPPPKKAPKF